MKNKKYIFLKYNVESKFIQMPAVDEISKKEKEKKKEW